MVDGVRSFATVAEVAQAVVDSLRPGSPAGTRNVGTRQLALPRLAEIVVDELGVDVPVEVVPSRSNDSAGVVRSQWPVPGASGWTDGIASGPTDLADDVRSFVRAVSSGPAAPLRPPVAVVVPPRPFEPDVVMAAQQQALWTGAVKHGNRCTMALTEVLTESLQLDSSRRVLVTASGTAALRLAVLGTAGPTRPGGVAVLPSFTFAATGEVLVQLGYRLRFVDIDPATWTLDPDRLTEALAPGDVQVVVAVDTFGDPCDYDRLRDVCSAAGVPLVADSAPSLGARYRGAAIGGQADAHAFSMSFAKVVSAGGAGGAVVLPEAAVAELETGPNWLRSSMMPEMAAAAALDLVRRLDRLDAARQEVAATYAEVLGQCEDVGRQQVSPQSQHAWVHWVLTVPGSDAGGSSRRDRVGEELMELGVGTKPYYSPALHTMTWPAANAPTDPDTALPVTSAVESQALALPMSSELSIETAEQIADLVVAVLDAVPTTESVAGQDFSAAR